MMLHMEDGAQLNTVINDDGKMLIICSKCKKVWVKDLDISISPKAQKESATTSKVSTLIRLIMNTNPRILDQIGLTSDVMSGLGL